MYNLNKGKNDNLLSMCRPLADYMTLINYIREKQEEGLAAEQAVDEAVKQCIEEIAEAQKVAANKEARKQFYREYGIVD